MKYGEWQVFYKKILKDFDFSEEEDIRAGKILNNLLKKPSLDRLEKKIKGKRVNVYGAGPSLDKLKAFPKGINISANGATSFLLERDIVPDVIVTDLDGKIEDLIKASEKGGIIVLHGHGDNMHKIARHAAKFENPFGTVQCRPFGNLLNFGGFTDGDRAVFLAEHFRAKGIILYGMDFHSEVGRYSFSEDTERKRKKLAWAEKLINYLMRHTNVKITYGDKDG